MTRFLSAEWTEQLTAALADANKPLHVAEITIQQIVTGAPEGNVTYWMSFEHGRVEGGIGDADAPDVTFSQDYETAAALSRGDINPQAAFMQGKLTITGNMGKLLQQQDAIQALGSAMASISTEY